jgi:hypothetical protein
MILDDQVQGPGRDTAIVSADLQEKHSSWDVHNRCKNNGAVLSLPAPLGRKQMALMLWLDLVV